MRGAKDMSKPTTARFVTSAAVLTAVCFGLARADEGDHLGWRYSVIAALASPAPKDLPTAPPRDADATWLRGWAAWRDRNRDILKNLRPILGEPAVGKVTGAAAFQGERGF